MRQWAINEFDPLWPEFAEDPYPYYSRLLKEDPVHYVPSTQSWWVTRYADALNVLSGRDFGNEAPLEVQRVYPEVKLLDALGIPPHVVLRDPPDHTRLRSLVGKAFTPAVVENLRPRISQIANELLEKVKATGRIDVVADFAFPLPAIVIAELLGVPAEDRDRFSKWSHQFALATDAAQPDEAFLAATEELRHLVEYFEELIGRHRIEKGDDLLTGLISVEEKGDKLSSGELLSMCIVLLNAGHETTKDLIATGTLALLNDGEQLALLRRRPELMRYAVEELLRYVSPGQRMPRYSLRDTELGGRRIRKGDIVEAVIGAANRDPEIFVNPNQLDITRKDNPHLALGRGIHFCLGAPLARVEAEIAFQALLRQFAHLRIIGQPQWNTNTRIRGLKSLPVALW